MSKVGRVIVREGDCLGEYVRGGMSRGMPYSSLSFCIDLDLEMPRLIASRAWVEYCRSNAGARDVDGPMCSSKCGFLTQ